MNSLTLKDIQDAMEKIRSWETVPPMPTIRGSEFTDSICKDVPRMQLSEKVPVTPEFRAEINAWMREFFGVRDVAYKFDDPLTGRPMIVTSTRAAEKANLEIQRHDPAYYEPIFRL